MNVSFIIKLGTSTVRSIVNMVEEVGSRVDVVGVVNVVNRTSGGLKPSVINEHLWQCTYQIPVEQEIGQR